MQFTLAALTAFRKMQHLEWACTCKPINWDAYWEEREPCAACEQWHELHSILYHELKLAPWQWYAVEHPNTRSPYPEGSHADKEWKPDLEAQERYRALEAACGEV